MKKKRWKKNDKLTESEPEEHLFPTKQYIYNSTKQKHTTPFINSEIFHIDFKQNSALFSDVVLSETEFNRETEIIFPEIIKVAHIEEIILSNKKERSHLKKEGKKERDKSKKKKKKSKDKVEKLKESNKQKKKKKKK